MEEYNRKEAIEYYNAGVFKLKDGKYKKAIVDLDKFLELDLVSILDYVSEKCYKNEIHAL